eukprot:jgi/Botrbrau1/2833/Bobra.0125s0040.1
MSNVSKDGSPEVTLEDQERINSFNKLFSRFQEIESELKQKKTLMDDLEDASNELMLQDDETVQYVIGECFCSVDPTEAEERIQEELEGVKRESDELEQERDRIKDNLGDLKAVLYGKFGNSINLETD